ncbi:MAG: hypothetical protein BMS9Abin26_0767 [Gammaproteobacteria bacterium]|nr:MAG: hypothetical protein BMS9Abin26_0767 [Gammaproteobacteria bacterium]
MSAGIRRHQVVVVVAILVLAILFIYTQSMDEQQDVPASRPAAVETPAVQTGTESEPEPVSKSEPEPEPESGPEPEKASVPTSPQAPPIAVPGTPADKSIGKKEDVEGEIAVGPCDGGGKTPEGVSSQRDKDSAHTGYTSSGGKPCIDIGSAAEDVKRPGMPPPVIPPPKPGAGPPPVSVPPPAPPVAGSAAGVAKP